MWRLARPSVSRRRIFRIERTGPPDRGPACVNPGSRFLSCHAESTVTSESESLTVTVTRPASAGEPPTTGTLTVTELFAFEILAFFSITRKTAGFAPNRLFAQTTSVSESSACRTPVTRPGGGLGRWSRCQ